MSNQPFLVSAPGRGSTPSPSLLVLCLGWTWESNSSSGSLSMADKCCHGGSQCYSVVSENLKGQYGGSKMAERGKLLWLEGQSADTTRMKSRQNSSLLDANLEADQRWWRRSKAHSVWKANKMIQDGEAVLIGRSMLGPKTCFSSKVPRDMERQQSSTFASYEKLGSVTEILLQPNP